MLCIMGSERNSEFQFVSYYFLSNQRGIMNKLIAKLFYDELFNLRYRGLDKWEKNI